MTFTKLTVLKVPEEVEAATGWTSRVFATIGGVPPSGLPLTGEVGAQPLEGLGIQQGLEPLLSGYLKTAPAPGDELVIRIGGVTIPTGLTVENPGIA